MARYTVFLDACVLYPAPLRDLLLELTVTDLFAAKWSDMVHDEWIRNVLRDRPDLTRERLQRTRQLMDAHARDALVTGFEQLMPIMELPDPDDRHVVAAAVKARADLVVTFNLKDFPARELARWNMEAQHPDEFLTHQFHLAEAQFLSSVRTVRQRLKNPPKSIEDYLDILRAQGLLSTVRHLEAFSQFI